MKKTNKVTIQTHLVYNTSMTLKDLRNKEVTMKKTNKDIIIVGFALFAMFFGAGNLLFPPFLGLITGKSWATGFTGFILADVGLSLLAILAIAKCNGEVSKIFSRAGHKLSIALGCAIMICIGPLLAIPRTAATTFEMGIQPIFNNFNSIVFSIIFFGITLLLTIRPSKVVDIIGSYLTPALLIALLVLIGMGIANPLGDIQPSTIEGVFSEGIFQGYQTLDALGAVSLGAVIITSIANKGYTKEKEQVSMTFKAGLVAGAGLLIVYGGLTYLGATVSGLFDSNVSQAGLIVSITEMLLGFPGKVILGGLLIVYGGLTYLGATVSGLFDSNVSQAGLIVSITEMLLGFPGKVILGIIVMLACLTTAIGLTSATGQYFSKLSNNNVKYEVIATVGCLFSLVVSNFGVDKIIQFSAPILTFVYPPTIVLVVYTLFGKFIKNDNVFKFGTYAALFISILNIVSDFGVKVPLINSLPLYSLGFNWVVPVLIASVIGFFVKSNSKFKSGQRDIAA